MSYLVLARKYRPRTFAEVVGQDVVARVLQGALEEGRVGHAYLFSGPRGTGKTTIARILAKCLNCEQGPTPTPCGTCPRCVAADEGTEVDIIELDAASNTGVDKVRQLRDEVSYAPMRARTKVYIIDEVHMLSKSAFNALLKTLEEPPPHVVFLFATTEPHKVLDTILSRCQVLRLNALSEEDIARQLDDIFAREEVRPGDGVVRELARGARGGMRDALSMADRLLALAGKEPALEDLARLGGDGGTREVDALLSSIEAGDRPGLLRALGGFEGAESELASGLLERLRASVVLLHCGEDSPLVSGSAEERQSAAARGRRLGAERLELMMQELLRARERMRLLAGQERLVLEVALLELARPESTVSLAELEERLAQLARTIGAGTGGPPPAAPRSPAPPRAPASAASSLATSAATSAGRAAPPAPPAPTGAIRPPAASPAASPVGSKGGGSVWEPFLEALRGGHGALADLFTHQARLVAEEEDDTFTLHTGPLSRSARKLVEDRRNRSACVRCLTQVVGRPVVLRWDQPDEGGTAAPAPAPGAGTSLGKSASRSDEFTQEVADLFGGSIEEMS